MNTRLLRVQRTNIFALALAVLGIGTLASADVIVDQPWDGNNLGIIAHVFPDRPDHDTFELDDFSTTQDYLVTTLEAGGTDVGNPADNLAVIGEIWDGLPGIFGGNLVMSSVSGVEHADGSVAIDFGCQLLPAGDYWITVYVVRNIAKGFNWTWKRTNDMVFGKGDPPEGSEHYTYNPGGGLFGGAATDPIPGSVAFFVLGPADMHFVLKGEPALSTVVVDFSTAPPDGLYPSYNEDGFTFNPLAPATMIQLTTQFGDRGLRLIPGNPSREAVRMVHEAGTSFDLQSLDVPYRSLGTFDEWTVESSAGGSQVLAGTGTFAFAGPDWSDLQHVDVFLSNGEPGNIVLDNLTMEAISSCNDCPCDIDGDGICGSSDLLLLLGSWGPCADCNNCPEDLDGDCIVGTTDLVIFLGNWGPCP